MGWHYCMAAMYYNSHLVRKGSGNECRSTYNLTLHYSNEIGLMMFFWQKKNSTFFVCKVEIVILKQIYYKCACTAIGLYDSIYEVFFRLFLYGVLKLL